MSIFHAAWRRLKAWFNASDFKVAVLKVEDEIERIGPVIFYAAINAGLSSLSESNKLTGKSIAAAADIAIDTLKAQGKQQVTAAVFTAIASALTQQNAVRK